MTPAQMSTVLTAGSTLAFENGDGPLGAVLAVMAAQCRRLHAQDTNPAYTELPPDASTIAMPALPDAARGRIIPVPFKADGDGFTLSVPIGWRLVQVLPEMHAQSTRNDNLMCVVVPDA
jgi:hypothetical protein